MNLKPITREESDIRVLAEPDFIPVEGNAYVSGDDDFDREVEHNILCRLHQGDVWAWAAVTVVARWGSFEGKAHLGCCSYADEADFRQPDGYFDDLVAEALEMLNLAACETYRQLREREQAV